MIYFLDAVAIRGKTKSNLQRSGGFILPARPFCFVTSKHGAVTTFPHLAADLPRRKNKPRNAVFINY